MNRAASAGPTETHMMPPLEMPRDEMAFRRQYEGMLVAQTLTTVFRPGDRRWPNWRGYRLGEIVTGRVITQPGSDALGIAPKFTPARIPIEIIGITVLAPDALTADDFAGSSPDVYDAATLLAHLVEIYGQPLSTFGDLVTRIQFTYVDPAVDPA